MMEPEWYTLYTTPRAEKRVYQYLKLDGWECYLPLHRTPRVWSDRVKMVEMPLFHSYIFVKCREFDVWPLLKIRGVVKMVYYNGKPAVIKEEEILAIRQFIKKADGKQICTGDEVEILAGSFKKVSGKIMKMQKKIIYLHLEQLAATVCVNLNKVALLDRIK